jgi:hypothetical protein
MIKILFTSLILLYSICALGQNEQSKEEPKTDFQIYLKQPAKEIKLLMYEKNFVPIQGTLSEDRKSIIMKNYENGNKVHVKVLYDDGTEEEFTKSPCYIDPVIT